MDYQKIINIVIVGTYNTRITATYEIYFIAQAGKQWSHFEQSFILYQICEIQAKMLCREPCSHWQLDFMIVYSNDLFTLAATGLSHNVGWLIANAVHEPGGPSVA